MGKLITSLFLVISLSAYSQEKGMVKIEGYQEEPIKFVATVQSEIGDKVVLQTNNSNITYVSNKDNLELEKEYVFWAKVIGCFECRTKIVKIIEAVLTTSQIQRDQTDAAKRVKELINNQ